MKNTLMPSMLAQSVILLLLSVAHGFDFVYFVQQWPGSYCDTKKSCCYPTSGKPAADFSIHGLWPNYENGSYPSFCNNDDPFVVSKISDLMGQMVLDWPSLACPSSNGEKFWKHEWEKHGTCSEFVDQHDYFETCLDLKKKANLLGFLEDAGIVPDGGFYSYINISHAIQQGVGHVVGIECNKDEAGNNQLYQVYLCLDNSTSSFIDCPKLPTNRCDLERIQFPSFSNHGESSAVM